MRLVHSDGSVSASHAVSVLFVVIQVRQFSTGHIYRFAIELHSFKFALLLRWARYSQAAPFLRAAIASNKNIDVRMRLRTLVHDANVARHYALVDLRKPRTDRH
jgi:hypothetical protein